jgi:hypothetical protein
MSPELAALACVSAVALALLGVIFYFIRSIWRGWR